MKVVERVRDVTSTLEGEKIGMKIAKGAEAFIMSILTDLYSDSELAVIREYSTNALDAHIEAGVTDPIEVTTPSVLSQFFRVRDYGFGLDENDIREIYSQYGASTKRASNDVVGMLGLGCKSALTYVDQFTLRSVKDGICTQVAISREEDGTGSMTVVDEYETDERQGTEIVIPAKRYNSFASKSTNFFKYWTPGTVLVDGKQPERIGGMWITDDLLLTNENDQNYVVMGNVAYPIPESRYRRWNYVAFVDIGELEFTPSRESLIMSPLTKRTLENIEQRVQSERNAAFERMIAAAPDRMSALRLSFKAREFDYAGSAQYNGEDIPSVFEPRDGKKNPWLVVEHKPAYKRGKYHSFRTNFSAQWAEKAVWLIGHDGSDFSAYKRQKLEQWVAEKITNGELTETPQYYVCVPSLPRSIRNWIDNGTVFKWDEVKSQKIVREKKINVNGRVSGSYKAWVAGNYRSELLASDIDTSKPIFWFAKDTDASLARELNPEATVVELAANRINKFTRDFPMAKNAWEWAREKAQAWALTLTHTDRLTMALNNERYDNKLTRLDAERIDDPEVVEAITAAKVTNSALLKNVGRFGDYVRLPDFKWENPLNNYPLLQQVSTYAMMDGTLMEEIYTYMNAAYAARKDS